jgi:hypothetical protein
MSSYYVFWRKERSQYFLVKFLDNEGHIVATRSTGETKREKAILVAAEMYRTGQFKKPSQIGRKPRTETLATAISFDQTARMIKTMELTPDQAQRLVSILSARGLLNKMQKANVEFVGWLRKFWTWDQSDYIKEKLSLGHKITKGYTNSNLGHVNTHYQSYFGIKLLSEISKTDLKSFFQHVCSLKLRSSTINSIMNVSKVALKWAYNNEFIVTDPAEGIAQSRNDVGVRGILNPEEFNALQEIEWNSKHAACGFLAAATGL